MRYCKCCGASLDVQTGDNCEYCGNPIRKSYKGFEADLSDGKGKILFRGESIPVVLMRVETEVIDVGRHRETNGTIRRKSIAKRMFFLQEL